MVAIYGYVDESGKRPFADWLGTLDATASAKINIAIARMEHGNFSNVKSVGGGVFEQKIDFGPGYRIYFGKDGATVVILLAGGTKKRQQLDIAFAQKYWAEYKRRKKQRCS